MAGSIGVEGSWGALDKMACKSAMHLCMFIEP